MMITKMPIFYLLQVVILVLLSNEDLEVSSLGSMSAIAVSYGENGPSFCGLDIVDGSRSVRCQGADSAVVYATPVSLPFLGLTAGDGFVCGLLMHQHHPYCWGNNIYIQMGVPQPMKPGATYIDISAGDHHLCALRRPTSTSSSIVDCWGYNMTNSYTFEDEIMSITGGSGFNCGLFVRNGTAVCWGDETSSGVISLIPRSTSFLAVSSGGFHVCGVLAGGGSRVFCWGRSLTLEESHGSSISGGNVDLVPDFPFLSVVGGRFHACGIRAYDHGVVCWGFRLEQSTPVPDNMSAFAIAAGDYFTCSVLSANSMKPICWGANFPTNLPLAVSPVRSSRDDEKNRKWSSFRMPVFLAELAIAVFLVSAVSLAAILYVRFKLQKCNCTAPESKKAKSSGSSSFRKEIVKVKPDLEELKIRRAQQFCYEDLEKATNGFSEESQVGRGSFSCVFKGVLKDGTIVAVKRAIMASDLKKNSKEFHTELDLLSRLNHAHLLNLLGYCEEGGERLLVYEFMSHGSLHELLHGKKKEPLDWIRRVTIAVQAARGIEYLHGYACPPVIHRDIKSSNILIDEEWNARVADFGLSLLGPADSSCPLSELPAGTLGYLDPEYYRLHYLTTKSDVYSFGVLLLEILSGRKAIDMQFEEGNIVEWAVPLIKNGTLEAILDASLKQPVELEALRKIANVACKCVRMRGKERPSMDKVTTALERALAVLMGSPSIEQPILPSEVVLGSSRLHKKASQRSSNRSASEIDTVDGDDQRFEFRAPSWITFPSLASSQRRKSSVSEGDLEGKNFSGNEAKIIVTVDGLRSLEEEIGPASPQQEMFLQHNF